MIRYAIAAGALLLTTPLAAQSTTQSEIQSRYDRALAAGYKALFLCSAIANAERNGTTRTPEHVEQWELTGIQSPLDEIVGQLPYLVYRDAARKVHNVEVWWAGENMPPRFAEAGRDSGCRLAPIGVQPSQPETAVPPSSQILPVNDPDVVTTRAIQDVDDDPFEMLAQDVVAGALSGSYGDGTRTTAVIVRQSNYQSEWYQEGFFPATPQRTWSVAKSIAATLVGAAVHRGTASVEQRLVWPEWRWDTRRTVTVDDFLRMASGRYSDTPGNRTDPLYYGGATVEESATPWPLVHPPGTVFRYANNDTLMAVKAIDETFDSYSPADFFAAVGMNHTVAETDWAGDYILSSQVWSTADDLAKLGQLYLNDGVLADGTSILPEGWVEYVSSPSGPQPEGAFGYGAGFWLFNNVDGVPGDTFAAMGNRGQFIVIVPSMDVVIVRRGEDPAGSRFDIAAFTRDVLESLDK